MTQHENAATAAAYLCLSKVRESSEVSDLGAEKLPAERYIQSSHPATGLPDTRSPGDPWHSEAYLIACLVRTHGWRVMEPGLMRRCSGLERSVTLPENRAAGLAQLEALRAGA